MKRHIIKKNIEDGFSSDEELKEEEIIMHIKREVESRTRIHPDLKLKIPPASELKTKALYSLLPDIQTGWIPKVPLPNPIPIIFKTTTIDTIIGEILAKKNEIEFQISYLGPRYENTYFIHLEKSYPFPYNHVKKPDLLKFTSRIFLGNNPLVAGLKFDSIFECGNLDCAIKISQFEYDLFILVDTNTCGHTQWYNFRVCGGIKGKKYIFNICNFQKNKSLYSRGMKPFIYSKKKSQDNNRMSWEQLGENLKYDQKPLRYQFLSSYDQNKFYRLSFQYIFQYEEDQIQVAYCVPYEYSFLLKFINQLIAKNKKLNNNFIELTKLTTSLGGLDVPLLTIHEDEQNSLNLISNGRASKQTFTKNCNRQSQQKIKKKCIIISGRAHPGQSNGSFMMHGFIDFICGFSPLAVYLRKNVVFKIVPMLNPDGVVTGNYRTGLSGKDFNRQFLQPNHTIFPEIWNLKDLIKKCKKQFNQNLLLFLDFHGHSLKKNVFMYGPQFSISDRYYYQTKIFPKLISLRTNMFRFYSCIFRISESKSSTARAVVLKKLDIPFSYTIEASNGSYYDTNLLKDIPFNSRSWIQVGNQIGQSLYQYCLGIIINQQQKIQKLKQRRAKSVRKKSTIPTLLQKHARVVKMKYSQRKNDMEKMMKQKKQKHKKQERLDYSKFKSLIQEIKKQEEQKLKEKIYLKSDDEMSEGDSDFEEQKDDLPKETTSLLYQLIKRKQLIYDLNQLNINFEKKLIQNNYQKQQQINQFKEEVIQQLDIFEQQQQLQKQQEILPMIQSQNNHLNKELKFYHVPQKLKPSNKIDIFKDNYIKQEIKKPILKVNNLSFLSGIQVRGKNLSLKSNFQLQRLPVSIEKYKNQIIKMDNLSPLVKYSFALIKQKKKSSYAQQQYNFHNLTFYNQKLKNDETKFLYERRKSINFSQMDSYN